jgi:hypothetical protein
MLLFTILAYALSVAAFPLLGNGPVSTEAVKATVPLRIGTGWRNFTFGAAGSTVPTSFSFTANELTLLKITDAYYAGDSFRVYDRGVLLGTSEPVPAEITNFTPLPDVAFGCAGWSSFYAYLPAGNHLISMMVSNSPYGSGTGNIRVDYERP